MDIRRIGQRTCKPRASSIPADIERIIRKLLITDEELEEYRFITALQYDDKYQ